MYLNTLARFTKNKCVVAAKQRKWMIEKKIIAWWLMTKTVYAFSVLASWVHSPFLKDTLEIQGLLINNLVYRNMLVRLIVTHWIEYNGSQVRSATCSNWSKMTNKTDRKHLKSSKMTKLQVLAEDFRAFSRDPKLMLDFRIDFCRKTIKNDQPWSKSIWKQTKFYQPKELQ